jgi:hypothetical protein
LVHETELGLVIITGAHDCGRNPAFFDVAIAANILLKMDTKPSEVAAQLAKSAASRLR